MNNDNPNSQEAAGDRPDADCSPFLLTAEELETLNPGIRHTVQTLRGWGFDTRDSGDGATREFPCDLPHPYVHILTTHHFDGDKANDAWWNLMPLCQVCHLQFQAKVDPDVPFFLDHSEWAKPYVAGFYALKYEGRMIDRDEAENRMEKLLSYELATGRAKP
jgi:hypothetical protein